VTTPPLPLGPRHDLPIRPLRALRPVRYPFKYATNFVLLPDPTPAFFSPHDQLPPPKNPPLFSRFPKCFFSRPAGECPWGRHGRRRAGGCPGDWRGGQRRSQRHQFRDRRRSPAAPRANHRSIHPRVARKTFIELIHRANGLTCRVPCTKAVHVGPNISKNL